MSTIGESRVRTTFNPANSNVDQIKQKSAELINLVNNLPGPQLDKDNSEFKRLMALAMTAYEEAAMWAVKAATI